MATETDGGIFTRAAQVEANLKAAVAQMEPGKASGALLIITHHDGTVSHFRSAEQGSMWSMMGAVAFMGKQLANDFEKWHIEV